MATRKRPTRRQRNQDTTMVIVLLVVSAGLCLWTAAPGHSASNFAPTGAMAAVMGVFLAVAVKRSAS